jgi:hypothetical protein
VAWTGPSGDEIVRGLHVECRYPNRRGVRVCGTGHTVQAHGGGRPRHHRGDAESAGGAGRPRRDVGGARIQRDLATAPSGQPTGPVPGAQHDQRDVDLHSDQRPDPQPRPGDARHQHVRAHLPAADQRGQHRRRPAHRTGHLGQRPADQRPERAGDRRAHGLDPARHGDPCPGRQPSAPGRSPEHPEQQHPAVLLRQSRPGQRRLRRRSSRTPTACCSPRSRRRCTTPP